VEYFNIVDEGVLRLVLRDGEIKPPLIRRMCDNVVFAESVGADLILVTCSSTSPIVDVAQKLADVPVHKIDQPMIEQAIETGERIGILATAPTTLVPTTDLLDARSRALGKTVRVEEVLCEGAYDALFAGDMDTNDRIVLRSLEKMMDKTDVVVLAQVSMARVAERIPREDRRVPILSSPRLCFEAIRKLMKQLPESRITRNKAGSSRPRDGRTDGIRPQRP
jgi:Asp/Glu/hydantoin racemase